MHSSYCAPEGEEFQQRLLSGPSADFCSGIYRKSKILSIDVHLRKRRPDSRGSRDWAGSPTGWLWMDSGGRTDHRRNHWGVRLQSFLDLASALVSCILVYPPMKHLL